MTAQEGQHKPARATKKVRDERELAPQMQALIREALQSVGRDPDAGLQQIIELVREDPREKTELEEMLLASFQDALARVMLPSRATAQK